MRYKKFKVLPIFLIIFCIVLNILLTKKLDQYFYLNTTKSLPRGLYLVTKKVPCDGDLVIIDLPLEVQNFLFEKQHLTFKGLLLKPVIAMNGDYVCTYDRSIVVNNKIELAKNKQLNLYPICRKLVSQELFVAVTTKDNSLDSRYFGPVLMQNLRGVVRPLIVFR